MKTKKATKKPRESAIQRGVLKLLALRRDVVAWRSSTGAARMVRAGGKVAPVFFGKKGQADITGLIKPWGVHLEIECKRPGEKQTLHQRLHEQTVRGAGGVYLLVDSIDACRAKLDEALAELSHRFGLAVPRENAFQRCEAAISRKEDR